RETGDALAARGHRVAWWPERIWRAGAVCTIHADLQSGIMTSGADPRRASYALGWGAGRGTRKSLARVVRSSSSMAGPWTIGSRWPTTRRSLPPVRDGGASIRPAGH